MKAFLAWVVFVGDLSDASDITERVPDWIAGVRAANIADDRW
jgi:hypothetical protein